MNDSPTTVLVVDDEPVVREVAERILHRAGFRVYTANDGAEAIHLCNSLDHRVDIVLTEIDLPQMGGPELARRLASHKPGMSVVLMKAGQVGTEVEQKLTSLAGLYGHVILDKPFTASRLLSAVQGGRAQSERIVTRPEFGFTSPGVLSFGARRRLGSKRRSAAVLISSGSGFTNQNSSFLLQKTPVRREGAITSQPL